MKREVAGSFKKYSGYLSIAFKSFKKHRLLVMMTVTVVIDVLSNVLAHELGQEIIKLIKMNV